ncbi:MAG: type IV toxin-antitoxin system AbiEi family antitoxin [Saprospiraceae bacterium]
MGESVYLSKNLTADQLQFMRVIEEHEVLYFDMARIEAQVGHRWGNLNEVLENLVHKKLLLRLERGKYTRTEFQDRNVLTSFISDGGVISYWSALHQHGLTDRFPNTLFVKTPKRKKSKKLLNTPIRFVTVTPRKMVGRFNVGYGDKSYPMTDTEATILDCFDHHRYAGEWSDLLRAFHQASMDGHQLTKYALAYQNLSAFKRLGYLAELLDKKGLENFIEIAQNHLGKEYTLFDPTGPDNGKYLGRWKLRLNLTEEQILNIIENLY